MIYNIRKTKALTAWLLLAMFHFAQAQTKVNSLQITNNAGVASVTIDGKRYAADAELPLVSYSVNKNTFTSVKPSSAIELSYAVSAVPADGELMYVLHFKNVSKDTIQLHNV
ncbi:MAG: hypothetical protein CRN43_11770, partial [Candidatus Nephrothrix sp. EaCA]